MPLVAAACMPLQLARAAPPVPAPDAAERRLRIILDGGEEQTPAPSRESPPVPAPPPPATVAPPPAPPPSAAPAKAPARSAKAPDPDRDRAALDALIQSEPLDPLPGDDERAQDWGDADPGYDAAYDDGPLDWGEDGYAPDDPWSDPSYGGGAWGEAPPRRRVPAGDRDGPCCAVDPCCSRDAGRDPGWTPTLDGEWRIQVGAFRSSGRAEDWLAQIEPIARGPGADPIWIVEPVETWDGVLYRAQLMGFVDRIAAEDACWRVESAGAECFVLSPR